MDWAGYVATLRMRVEEMDIARRYSIKFDLYKGTPAEDFMTIEEDLHAELGLEHVHILDELRGFYVVTRGFDLQWMSLVEGAARWQRVRRGDKVVNVSYGRPSGRASIANLSQLYTPLDREDAGERNVPYSSIFEDYRTLDSLSGGDRVAVRFFPDRQDPALFYHRHDTDSYHPLALGFTTYMELLLEARALKGWQQFFIADPAYEVEPAWMEWFHANLARLFPDADASRFRR